MLATRPNTSMTKSRPANFPSQSSTGDHPGGCMPTTNTGNSVISPLKEKHRDFPLRAQQWAQISSHRQILLYPLWLHCLYDVCRGHQIPFKRNLPSPRKRWVWQHTCLISTHFYCNRLKSQHCQKALMTKQPWAGRCNHHTES